MQTFQVAGKIRLTKNPVTVEVKAEDQQAAEVHVEKHCPDIEVVKTPPEPAKK